MLIELGQALISYQDYHMLLLTPAQDAFAHIRMENAGEQFDPQNHVGRGWGIRYGAMGAVRLPKIPVLTIDAFVSAQATELELQTLRLQYHSAQGVQSEQEVRTKRLEAQGEAQARVALGLKADLKKRDGPSFTHKTM